MSQTHRDLVERAGRWLRNTKKLPCVLLEVGTDGFECPDVIGWDTYGRSWLIEVKVSRSDFLADRKKAFRTEPMLGLGNFRLYAVPPGLVKMTDLPPGWGLLEVRPKTVKVLQDPKQWELTPPAHRREKRLLVSAFRRSTEGYGQKVFGVLEDNDDPEATDASG